MKKRRSVKSILSVFLASLMLLNPGLEPLAGSGMKIALAAESDIVLKQSELAVGMNVIPQSFSEDAGFMSQYVKTNKANLNLNSLFVKNNAQTKNVKGAGSKLSTDTMRADSSSVWYAQYTWNPTAQQEALLADTTNYPLVYEGNIVPDYHTHNYVVTKTSHWSKACVRLYKNAWTYGSEDRFGGGSNYVWLKISSAKNDGEPQAVKETVDSISLRTDDYLTFTAYNQGTTDCGDPRVGGSVFYMIDKSVPKVIDTYIANDAAGSDRVGRDNNFGTASSLTKYVVMEFSENVRLSDNYASKEALKIKLDACYGAQAKGKNEGDIVGLEATLIAINGNKMIFEFTIPSIMNGAETHIYITGVSTDQRETFNKIYDLTLYSGDGAEFTAANDLKSTSRITDLAGNALDWSSSNRSIGTVDFDNVNPTMASIQMTGNMITGDSYKEPTGWEEGNEVDLSAQFAGAGDTIGYQVYFSESINNIDTDNGKAVLNIKDEDGQYITLGIKSVRGNCITFDNLTIAEGMVEPGTRILITKITGLGDISDYAGNTFTASNFSNGTFSDLDTVMTPDQQIRLDVNSPSLTLGHHAAETASWSTADANGGEYITIPIRVKEWTDGSEAYRSSVDGQTLKFALVLESKTLEYSWYIDTNQASKTTGWGATGKTAPSEGDVSNYLCSYSGLNDGTLYYLHIRLNPSLDYNYTTGGLNLGADKGIYFDGTLYAQTQDWAGNRTQSTYGIHHKVDTQAPTGGLSNNGQLHLNLDFANQTATITGSGWLKDNYCLGQAVYTWYYRLDGAQDWTTAVETVVFKETETGDFISTYNTGDLKRVIPFTNSTNRSGEFYLTVEYQDVVGHVGTKLTSQTLSYNITKAASHFDVADSSQEQPLLMPQVILSAPSSPATNVQYRTLMFFPYKATIDGVEIDYIMYDPRSGSETSVEGVQGLAGTYIDDNLFQGLHDLVHGVSAGEERVTLPGDWYALCGTIDANGNGTFSNYYDLGVVNDELNLERDDVQRYLEDYYGSLELIFVTSMFTSWNYTDAYDFIETLSTVDRRTVYLANDATYDVMVKTVTDGSGADAEELLKYSPGEVPAKTLDHVAVELQLTNTTDVNCQTSHGFGYGMETIDYGTTTDSSNVTTYNSYAELRYCGDDKNYGSVVHTWPIQPGTDGKQTLVIPQGVASESGYYSLRVILTNLNGTTTVYEPLGYYFFMDGTEMSLSLDSYYKEYDYDSDKGSVYSDLTIRKEDLEHSTELIELGLDGVPNEDWTLTTYLTFSRTERTDGLKYAAAEDFLEMAKVRVRNTTYDMAYNKYLEDAGALADHIPATTAIWVDASSQTSFQYVPVMAEDFPAEAYGTAELLQLPMLAGYNLLVYELENTNGVVTRKEIAVYIHPESLEWQADYAVTGWSGDYIREVTVTPTVMENPTLDGCHFNYVDSHSSYHQTSYVFTDDVDEEFYLLDQYGNLSVRHLAIVDENGQLINIDGEKPYYMEIRQMDGGDAFHLFVYANDYDSVMTLKDMTLTFDSAYTEALLGLTDGQRDGTTKPLTMTIPLAMDENGNYLMNEDGTYAVWESYDTSHNGIYKTQIHGESAEEDGSQSYVGIDIWGTWKYDEKLAEQYNDQRTLTFTISDAYGNETTESITLYGGTSPYYMSGGSLVDTTDYSDPPKPIKRVDIDHPINEDGVFGIYFNVPLAAVEGYGAGLPQEQFTMGQEEQVFHTTAPMILQDGVYTFYVTDLFGERYGVELDTTIMKPFGELGIGVDFSTTEPTNQDVIVTAWATGNVEKIISITSSTGVVGTIDPVDPQSGSITVGENCSITIKTDSGAERVVQVANIDKTVDPARVVFYDAGYAPLSGSEVEVEGEVVARLVCDTEYVSAINGSETYIFPAGSKKGDTYTFEYMDLAGNVGTVVAVLPCDVIAVVEEGHVDTEAPDLLLDIYSMRNQTNIFMSEWINPCDGVYTDETGAPITGGAKINEVLTGYKAQQFKLVFTVSDESDIKFVVQESGAAAPADYVSAANGCTVDGVTMSAANGTVALTITENVTFDIYVIDAKGNRVSVTGISVDSIVDTAIPLYPKYEVGMDEYGVSIVTVTFLPAREEDTLEPIYPLTENVLSKPEEYDTGETEWGYNENNEWVKMPIMKTIPRYYYIFTGNGSFRFTYQDQYGNVGYVDAEVKAMNTVAPKVLTENWYGTKYNQHPSTKDLTVVNRDVTALLNMSKAISNVTLYLYDEEAPNGLGTPLSGLSEALPVSVAFTGTNVYVTYTGNVDQKIVAEFAAAENSDKGYHVLDAVTCIDKDAPVITDIQTRLAEDKRSMVISFVVDEAAILSQNASAGMVAAGTPHVWIAKDNEPVELQFTDVAGNITYYQVVENAVVDVEQLKVEFSIDAAGVDATRDPVTDLALKQGESFYIRVNKEATILLNGEAVLDGNAVTANTWTQLTLPDEPGLHNMILTDVNTGEVVKVLAAAQPKDNVAPVIHLDSTTVVLEETATVEEMLTAIRDGVMIQDNIDPSITEYVVSGQPESVTPGLYTLTYMAEDEAGNQTTANRTLYIMAEGTPLLWVNGEAAPPYGIVTIKVADLTAAEIQLALEGLNQEAPVVIKYRSDIRTTGQMKYSSFLVEDMSFTVTDRGHYTIYVRTQDRVEYVTYIYVEEE